jgi:hypothetical protein
MIATKIGSHGRTDVTHAVGALGGIRGSGAAHHFRHYLRSELAFQRQRSGSEQAATYDVQITHEQQRRHGHDREHQQGFHAPAGDHAIEYLQHEDRRHQHQQIDDQAEEQRVHEESPEFSGELPHRVEFRGGWTCDAVHEPPRNDCREWWPEKRQGVFPSNGRKHVLSLELVLDFSRIRMVPRGGSSDVLDRPCSCFKLLFSFIFIVFFKVLGWLPRHRRCISKIHQQAYP